MSSIILPDYQIDSSNIPLIRIKSIHFKNYKAFDDAFFDFTDNNECQSFICFHGPNGCGKTTILEAITLIFSRLDGREEKNIKALLGKSVRHIEGNQTALYDDNDFLITANIHSSIGNYEVQINKTGFVKDHPQEIKDLVYRICYYARFDQELHQFQLNRNKWNLFKDLFQSVTGFKVEEKEDVFSASDDPVQSEILNKYVLGFWIKKPDETISHRECSAGERKIIKSFSTLLNKEYMPSIVCIDNAEMHVEAGRHINLIESMKRCFPDSQIFASTHSYQISRSFGNKKQLYDMRLLKTSEIVKEEPWRLYVIDEIKDNISKLNSVTKDKHLAVLYIEESNNLIEKILVCKDKDAIIEESCAVLKKSLEFYVNDISTHIIKKIRTNRLVGGSHENIYKRRSIKEIFRIFWRR